MFFNCKKQQYVNCLRTSHLAISNTLVELGLSAPLKHYQLCGLSKCITSPSQFHLQNRITRSTLQSCYMRDNLNNSAPNTHSRTIISDITINTIKVDSTEKVTAHPSQMYNSTPNLIVRILNDIC